jgi:hypothetical protein
MPSSEGTVQEGTEFQGKKNHAIAREFWFAAFKCDANMKICGFERVEQAIDQTNPDMKLKCSYEKGQYVDPIRARRRQRPQRHRGRRLPS